MQNRSLIIVSPLGLLYMQHLGHTSWFLRDTSGGGFIKFDREDSGEPEHSSGTANRNINDLSLPPYIQVSYPPSFKRRIPLSPASQTTRGSGFKPGELGLPKLCDPPRLFSTSWQGCSFH